MRRSSRSTASSREAPQAGVWGVWAEGAFYFGTNSSSVEGRNLARDPGAVIHLESGDEVVILRGDVDVREVDDSILDADQAKYGYRPPGKEPVQAGAEPRARVARDRLPHDRDPLRFRRIILQWRSTPCG
jgi:hypothetical protein